MTSELEMAIERLTALATDLDYAAMPTKPDVVTLCGGYAADARDDLRLILSANREMREALAAIEATDTEFHETGRDQWGYAELEECMSADEVRYLARSALTTQRGDGE